MEEQTEIKMYDHALVPTSQTSTDSLATFASIETDELIAAFLSGKSSKTIEAYKRDLEDFRQFLKVTDIDSAAKSKI
jgi:hypothetical protein